MGVVKHGLWGHPLYDTYINMLSRCKNPDNQDYEYYGGKGIGVCERWSDKERGLQMFIEDMGDKPEGNFSLDRVDSKKDYCPENCRWASPTTQTFNRGKLKSNTSGRTGVEVIRVDSKGNPTYRAIIYYKRERHYLGCSKSFEEAVRLREEAELKFYGKVRCE